MAGLEDESACAPPIGLKHLFCVHQLLDWKQARTDPQAIAAVRAEVDALAAIGTWDTENVYPKDELIAWAQSIKSKLIIGEGLGICFIKNSELPITDERRKHKGRFCYRTPTARDENGAIAIFQEMASRPTTIVSLNVAIAYGVTPGNATSVADAIKAYVQSKLDTSVPTYIELPKQYAPAKWKHINRPCCRLLRALYGHPEAGGHWENHLSAIIKDMGGCAVTNHPSVFWFSSTKLLLIVYVDDLLLSGPAENHADFWVKLRLKVDTDPPEPLDRYLGRHHYFAEVKPLAYNLMEWFESPVVA